MPKKRFTPGRSSAKKAGFNLKGMMVFVVAIVLTAAVWAFRDQVFDLFSDAAVGPDDYLRANGNQLVYKGQPVVLRGANFDNIGALGAGIGSNNVNNTYYDEEDYKAMAMVGGNHVRLGISYTWWKNQRADFYRIMDGQVALAEKYGIFLLFNNFINPDGNDGCYEGYGNHCEIWTNSSYRAEVEAMWDDIAARYKDRPAVIGYDLVNEPTPPGPNWCRTWYDWAQELVKRYETRAPNQFVFIEACSDPAFDRVFKNIAGGKATNVVYEVHDYDPMGMSHTGYGATSAPTYPGNASVWVNAGTQKTLFFDKSTFAGTRYPEYSTMQRYSINWAKSNGVPIYVGEWGAQGWLNGDEQYIKDKGEVYRENGVNHAFYTWTHQVTSGWRWGVFERGAEIINSNNQIVSPDPGRLAAMISSIQGSFRPNFGTGGGFSPLPSPSTAPTPSVVASTAPTPSPRVSPSPSPRVSPTPVSSPTTVPSPVVSTPPVSGGYPRVLQTTNSRIRVVEFQAPVNGRAFLRVEPVDGLSMGIVDTYVNGRWTAEDNASQFFVGGQSASSNGLTLATGANVRLVVYPGSTKDRFVEGSFTYPGPAVVATPPTTGGSGLKGDYFDGTELEGLMLKSSRIDSELNFNWGTGTPFSALGNDTFSVRWTGSIKAPTTGWVRFYTKSDDGARMWVNNKLLTWNWSNTGFSESGAAIYLEAGKTYPIKVEYVERSGNAQFQLYWKYGTGSQTLVPASALSPQ